MNWSVLVTKGQCLVNPYLRKKNCQIESIVCSAPVSVVIFKLITLNCKTLHGLFIRNWKYFEVQKSEIFLLLAGVHGGYSRHSKKPADSLYVMANHGQLLEYSLEPVPDPSKLFLSKRYGNWLILIIFSYSYS